MNPRESLGGRNLSRFSSAVIACATAASMSGCSFVAVRPSPVIGPDGGAPRCSSDLAPALDAVAAAGLAFGAQFAVSFNQAIAECGSHPNDSRCQFSVKPFVPAAIAAASSIYGFWAVSRCARELPTAERTWRSRDESPTAAGEATHARVP
jgi:hypothetical protein